MQVVSVSTSVLGKVRTNNEDNLFVNGTILPQNHEDLSRFICSEQDDTKMNLMAVFDGVGGAYYGEEASYEGAREMQRAFLMPGAGNGSTEKFFLNLCDTMNQKICQRQEENMASMGSTVSALLFQKGEATICNLGDSPIFSVRDGQICRIHEEHTNRRFLQNHKIHRKPELTQCLGISEEELTICPYIHRHKVQNQDWYLICSDGLTDMVSDQEILTIIQSKLKHEEKVKELVNQALEKGGRDNITVVLINVRE